MPNVAVLSQAKHADALGRHKHIWLDLVVKTKIFYNFQRNRSSDIYRNFTTKLKT